MLPTRVALVPYEAEVKPTELLHVAAALQMQVARDLSPLWDVSAVVSPFLALGDVPPGFLPLVVVGTALPMNRAGFHLTTGGQPAALIEYCGDWSTSASHELIEMLCDPGGTTTLPGSSLGDQKKSAGATRIVKGDRTYQDQGFVKYLMEVCDPCEASTYKIDGVNVSDFVTPHYYNPPSTGIARYSFTGRVNGPLRLLGGGYITWTTQPPDSAVFQAYGPLRNVTTPVAPKDLEIVRLGEAPPVLSRQWLDALAQTKSTIKEADCGKPASYIFEGETGLYGETLRIEIRLILNSLAVPSSNLDAIISLVRSLAQDDSFRQDFMADPVAKLRMLNIPVPPNLTQLDSLPPPESYEDLLRALQQGNRFGLDFTDPHVIALLAKFY